MKKNIFRLRESILNERGMSLITVIVAAGIGVIIATTFATMFDNMNKSQNNLKFRADSDVVNDEIRAHLSSMTACKNTFGGLLVDSASASHVIAHIKNNASPPENVFSTGNKYGDNSLLIREMTLNTFVATTANRGNMDLVNIFDASKPGAGIPTSIKRIKLSIELDSDKKIYSCVATSKMSDGIWQRVVNSLNIIYFIAGAGAERVGIGTSAPENKLHVHRGASKFSNEDARSLVIQSTHSSGDPNHASSWIGIRSRGTGASPQYPQAGDHLAYLTGRDAVDGLKASNYGGGAILFQAVEDMSALSKGTKITFWTTPKSSQAPVERMTIGSEGIVGIGTLNPAANFEVASQKTGYRNHGIISSQYSDDAWAGTISLSKARGTPNSPQAIKNGDTIGVLSGYGYDGTNFGATYTASILFQTRQDFSATAHGSAILFYTTTKDSVNTDERMRIDDNGYVGIGVPTPTEKVHIRGGNLRVQGSADCIVGSGSSGITCSSDIELKDNVHVIEDPLTKLFLISGVEFDWNHKSQNPGAHGIGVIAQDVEKAFPTAVFTDVETGYKRVDYAALVAPLIQALKTIYEHLLKLADNSTRQGQDIVQIQTENAQLKAENAAIKAYLCKKDPLAEFCGKRSAVAHQ